jgi:hypothetical protein
MQSRQHNLPLTKLQSLLQPLPESQVKRGYELKWEKKENTIRNCQSLTYRELQGYETNSTDST